MNNCQCESKICQPVENGRMMTSRLNGGNEGYLPTTIDDCIAYLRDALRSPLDALSQAPNKYCRLDDQQ